MLQQLDEMEQYSLRQLDKRNDFPKVIANLLRHFEVDHILPKAKGGGDYFENYQLLCSSCNRIKGNRPMTYLKTKLERMDKILKDKLTFGD